MKFCPDCRIGFPDHTETCPTHGAYLSEIIDLKPGMLIRNTYRIVRKLGQGGFGAVYLSEQILMDELRAIKFLSREWSHDEAFTSRFRREVRMLRQLRHRNIVDCGDLERAEDDSLFFSMEYVDGPDLRALMDNIEGPFDVRHALELTRGIAEGLGAAHAKGMVHRDIKPENILLAGAQTSVPKIVDFGIVATKEGSIALTRTGGTLLTVAYAAPEQWRGVPATDLDGRTDLYALGGVLFEMLTCTTVFKAESYEGWATQHLNALARPPSAVRPDLINWKGLDALVVRLLAKERDRRPKDVGEVLRLLGEVHYVSPRTRRPTVVEQLTLRSETVMEAPAEALESLSSRAKYSVVSYLGRYPIWAWGILAALVLIAIAAALWPPI